MNILTISLLSLIGVCLLIGIIKGATRGIGRQAVRTITVVLSAVIAIIVARTAGSSIYSLFATTTSEDIIAVIEGTGFTITGTPYETIALNLDPETINYIIAIPLSLVILPLIFVIIFYILKLLTIIVHVLVSGLCGFSKKRNNGLTRILGAILGAATGFAIAVVVATPVVGLISSADYVVNTLREDREESEGAETIVTMYDEQIAPYTNEPVSKLISSLGAKALYTQFSNVTIDEYEYSILEELADGGAEIAAATLDGLQGFAWKTPQGNNKEGLVSIVSAIDEGHYIKNLFLNVKDTIVDIYNDGSLIIDADELLVEAVDATFDVLENIKEDTFAKDINTLLDVYYILGREGVLVAFESGELEVVRDTLIRPYTYDPLDPEYTGGPTTIIDRVIEILNSNDETRPLVSALTKITLSALANNLGTDLSVEEIYDGVRNGINGTLSISKEGKTEEEYKDEVKASIDAALRSSDIALREDEEYILDGMADYVYENYDELVKVDEDGNHEITDAEINEVILSYYEAYLSKTE